MSPTIPSSRPSYDDRDLKRLEDVLDRNHTAEGPETSALRDELSTYFQPLHPEVAPTSSGTTALHLVLEALGVGPGDEVIIPSYACLSLCHAVRQAGARPVLADVEPDSMCLSAETVKPRLSKSTAAIILVHQFGYPVRDEVLFDYDVPVVEDVAQAFGATINGTPVGQQGEAAVGSFYATKQVPAGYGGFVATGNPNLAAELRDLKQYDGREQYRVAYNYSLSDLEAALARSQLARLDEHQKRRRQIARRYDDVLSSRASVSVPDRAEGHGLNRYVVQPDRPDAFEQDCQNHGITVKRPVHRPIHHYEGFPSQPTSQNLHEQIRLIPNMPSLTEDELDHICQVLAEVT